MRFGSDNQAGGHPRIVEGLAAAAADAAKTTLPAYGADRLTGALSRRMAELFEREVAVFLVATGTAANALALSAFSRPGGTVFCHRQAHIFNDEAGAPEFLASCRLTGLEGPAGKIDPGTLAETVSHFHSELARQGVPSQEHHGQPMAVSISQVTELGGVYRPAEVAALAEIAHGKAAALHMDGARFANAAAALGAAPADLTWRAGVDVLSFGGTKNGCLAAEAVVFFDKAKAAEFLFLRKRAGHLLSKSWVVAAQLLAYTEGGLWLELAAASNARAARLAAGIAASSGGRLALPAEANEVFAILKKDRAARLKEAGAIFYEWASDGSGGEALPEADEVMVRLVTSFQTTDEDVDRFVGMLG